MDRREARREFKARKTLKGIFVIRCRTSGEAWVSSSADLNAAQTGAWFLLRNGMHHNRKLQAAWDAHGGDTFEFQILEQFDEETPPLLVRDMLRDRQKHWQAELRAAML